MVVEPLDSLLWDEFDDDTIIEGVDLSDHSLLCDACASKPELARELKQLLERETELARRDEQGKMTERIARLVTRD